MQISIRKKRAWIPYLLDTTGEEDLNIVLSVRVDERGQRRGANEVLALLIHEALGRATPTVLRHTAGRTKRYTAELDLLAQTELGELFERYERELDLHLVRTGKAKKPKKSAVLRQLIHDEADRCRARQNSK